MTSRLHHAALILFLLIAVGLQGLLSFSVREKKAMWMNVPPVPSSTGVAGLSLGDEQLAYRMIGIMLQNLGNTAGRSTNLGQYNYKTLGGWFEVADKLDPNSNFLPFLAAFYFGATDSKEDLTEVVDYLAEVGDRPGEQKWRWLAQAVFLARYEQEDFDKSYRLAQRLADKWQPGRPAWVKQMPALILTARGNKEAAYDIMVGILKEDAEKMDPAEVRFMVDHICSKILMPDQAQKNPICQ